MNVKALEIRIGSLRAGILFQYAAEGAQPINRFVVDRAWVDDPQAPTISLAFLAASREEQRLLWQDYRNPAFNGALSKDGRRWLLPPFFQNLLPEGVFRDHIAQLRHCDADDHLELLAACGNDLPGNVYALPAELSRKELGFYVTQDADALEMTVTAEPLEEGVSLSGVQPKLGVIKDGDRYVGRTKDQDTHIIAKLPVVTYPFLPEVEELSLHLAKVAGVNACEAYLVPLSQLAARHHYDVGDALGTTNFLAVKRYDRRPGERVHCEDFAQVFGVMPEDKYTTDVSYLAVAAVLLSRPSLGEAAVHELLKRIIVNEMLGNPDMHLKNLGLWYPDGNEPQLPPAYDIVAHADYTGVSGHGLRILPESAEANLQTTRGGEGPRKRKLELRPAVLREFCNQLGIAERPAIKAVSDCVRAAHASWPALIQESVLTDAQKTRLMDHFLSHHAIASLERRGNSR